MLRAYAGPARVIVGYDGSDDASLALRHGCREALERGADLAVVHAVDDTVLNSAWGVVFDPDVIREAATELVTAARTEALALGVAPERVSSRIELGNPAAALARHSEEANLIVVGRRSVVAGEREFVGSTAVGLAGTAHSAVMVVGLGDEVTPIARIGVGVNTAARGAIALEWALREAERRGAAITVFSICKAPQSRFFLSGAPTEEQQAEAVAITRERISGLISQIAGPDPAVPIDLEVEYGSPVDILVARTDSVDLLVLEVQAAFPTYSVGGVTRGVMTHAHCPVVTLRARDTHAS